MSDNVTLRSATGTVAADEVADGTLGTVKVQYVKLMDGTLDSTTKYGGTTGLPVAEQAIPYAEDNTNQVIAVIARPFISTAYERLSYNRFGTETTGLIKGSQAQLFSIRLDSTEATTLLYLQLKNKATAFAAADVPDYSLPISVTAANMSVTVNLAKEFLGEAGKNFALGLTWGISSTKATYTAAGTAANYQLHLTFL